MSKKILTDIKEKKPMLVELDPDGTTRLVFKLKNTLFITKVEQTYNKNQKIYGTKLVLVTVIDIPDIDDKKSNMYKYKRMLS